METETERSIANRPPMDMWKFFDITHREHVVMNPTSEEKLRELVELVRLPSGSHALDFGCGKAEFLIRLARKYGTRCTGIDLSPHCIAQARERVAASSSDGLVELLEMDGASYRPDSPRSLALASCLGASWIFGGHSGTLEALSQMVAPGGWVLAGEPYWITEPADEYLHALEEARESFGTHESNARKGEEFGLDLVYTIVSSKDDWDRYEGLQWYAAAVYAREHPEDPDLTELTSRIAKQRSAYLKWGRDTLGWAIYVFRRES